MLVDNNPRLPNRSAALLGEGPSPGPELAKMAQGLVLAGADLLVMPCNTAHSFRADIKAAVSVPFVDMIEETATHLRESCPGTNRVGLMAAVGCVARGLYDEALVGSGIVLIPPRGTLMDELMSVIALIKAGHVTNSQRQHMKSIASELIAHGAQALISGCTEIPLVLAQEDIPVPLISSTDVLAQKTVAYALGRAELPRKFAAI